MKNQEGKTFIKLMIAIIIIAVIVIVGIYYSKNMIQKTQLQDFKTNMLLIQVKAKEVLEQVSFEKNKINNNDITLETLKEKYLVGTPLTSEMLESFPQQVKELINSENLSEYYYFTTEQLNELGINNAKSDGEDGYYIVRYIMDTDASVEVINTKGYEGKYTIEQIELLEN